jgi:catechol 2,3-dioxygenase-like lactoylglutathione lyase family enzyme
MRSGARAWLAAVVVLGAGPGVAAAADADLHHIHITTSSPSEGVRWYGQHFGCKPIADRTDAATCGRVELIFVPQLTTGGTQGTGINHISFSFADLAAKMTQLERVGVGGSGVRLQRFPGGAMIQELPGLYKHAFIFDPWGTRIELVEDPELVGFHHVHLSAANPEATLTWYQNMLGGQRGSLKGRENGVRFGEVWVLAARHEETTAPATTKNRAVDHIAFVAKTFDPGVADLRQRKVAFVEQPGVPQNARTQAKRAVLSAPDSVHVELVEAGFTGVRTESVRTASAASARRPYSAPKLPWGEPDIQGMYTGNGAHGIPLERGQGQADVKELTPEQAAARRERGTLGSIWGYEREWRDTTLGLDKAPVSTQVAMIIEPADGRIPPVTEAARARQKQAFSRENLGVEDTNLARGPAGPEDLGPYVRCITRGAPGMMMPGVYNNGLQIVQGPGFVAIQNEMIHETRVIPTTPRERRSAKLATWLGDPQGRWEGDTLVVETTNFNGRMSYRGSSPRMKLIERFTRVAPNVLEYRFTIDDTATWAIPWTGMFHFDKDDEQYELVEYACHEHNYGMFNILSGARADDKAAAAKKAK